MNKITTDDLRKMGSSEGLILQGCGGEIQEWVDGINGVLTDAGILLDGNKFTDVSTFENEGLTNLLFKMDDVKLDVGKLAMWRLQTHEQFGGTWLSDYVPNRLGGFVKSKDEHYEQLEDQIEKLYTADTHTSPDFQSDQTEGFPTSLCVNWDEGKAWLALNYSLVKSGEDVSHYEKLCLDFGIHDCPNAECFNNLLKSLGEVAYENAVISIDNEEQAMQL